MMILGDCIEKMRDLPDASVDAVVTDPPYGINFMGKAWDGKAIEEAAQRERESGREMPPRLTGGKESKVRKLVPRSGSAFANRAGEAGAYDFSPKGNQTFQEWTRAWATEASRVLKPGGHLLSFASTRTYHRMACGVEEAGFEIRDTLAWMFGSGFPKSLDVSKAIGRQLDSEREVIGRRTDSVGNTGTSLHKTEGFAAPREKDPDVTAPTTEAAKRWDGWGTSLKPAFEPIVLARKPLAGTVAANVLEHGTGALNIDACRIPTSKTWEVSAGSDFAGDGGWKDVKRESHPDGRWPVNVALDEEAAALLDEQTGELISGAGPLKRNADKFGAVYGAFAGGNEPQNALYGDRGGASRFFYCAKVSRAERNAGLDGFEERLAGCMSGPETRPDRPPNHTLRTNHHPTVKPIDLMRWLIRLITPPGGTVLDPFLGSGSTGCAAALEGVAFIGIEREADYMRIAEARIAFWQKHGEDGLRIVRERDAAERRHEEVRAMGQLDLLDAA